MDCEVSTIAFDVMVGSKKTVGEQREDYILDFASLLSMLSFQFETPEYLLRKVVYGRCHRTSTSEQRPRLGS